MERLTGKDELGYYMPCDVTLNCLKHRGECVDRLGAYEDTGLTPERCAELAEADRDGRLVVLPCKVGVHVWINGREAVILKFFGFKDERYFEAQFFDTQQYIALAFDEIGKTVFLTREEAEQALKEAKDDG